MKRRKFARKQNTSQKSWFTVFILSSILILLALFIYKINSSVTINTEAKGSCFCGELRCFNGNNLQKAYTENNGQPQCCFGWPTGTLKNVEKNTCTIVRSVNPTAIPMDTGLGDGEDISPTPTIAPTSAKNCLAVSCNGIGYNLISTKYIKKSIVDGITSYYPNSPNANCSGNPFRTNVDIISYCSTSCVTGTVGYGYCQGRSVWVKVNENYDPAKDQVKTLGYYTNSDCTRSYLCNITPTSRPSPSPTPVVVVKSKKVVLSNPNSINLVIVNITQIGGSTGNSMNWLPGFGLNTFSAGATHSIDYTDNPDCQKNTTKMKDGALIENSLGLYIVYRKSGFFSMFSPTHTTTIIPCYKDNFSIIVPLKLP